MTTLRHLDRMLAIASALTIAACGGGYTFPYTTLSDLTLFQTCALPI